MFTMGDEFLRLESGELAVMLENYLRQRQKSRPPVVTVRRSNKRPASRAPLAATAH